MSRASTRVAVTVVVLAALLLADPCLGKGGGGGGGGKAMAARTCPSQAASKPRAVVSPTAVTSVARVWLGAGRRAVEAATTCTFRALAVAMAARSSSSRVATCAQTVSMSCPRI